MTSPTPSDKSHRLELFRWLLESRGLVVLVAVVAAILTAPTLATGLHTEDIVQKRLVQQGNYQIPWRMNLFGHHGKPSIQDIEKINYDYKLFGWFPWITDARFNVSFWRPLASATHIVEYRYYPDKVWLMHAQSMLWYALLAGVVAAFYRRLLKPRWLAGLAAVLYAIDDAHGHAVGWLANRNGIMGTLFAVLALWAFDRWRRDGWKAGMALTPLLLFVGLTCAELALCAGGFFIAHALFVDEARPTRRAVAALSWLSAVGVWAVIYRLLGHQSFGSGLYINPTSEPIAYSIELVERAVTLLCGQLGTPPSNLWIWTDRREQGYLVYFAAVFVLCVATLLWPLLRRDRTARFWAAGTVLSLPPACATFPEDRLLFFAGLGAMPLVATFLAACFGRARDVFPHRLPVVALAAFWIVLHGVVAPIALPYRSLYMHRYDARIRVAGDKLFEHVESPTEDSLIVVNAEDYYFIGMVPLTRATAGGETVSRMITLAGTLEPVRIERIDLQTIEVRPKDGFLSRAFNRIYRGRAHPMSRGQRIDLHGVTVEIAEVDQHGMPTLVRFVFALRPDDGDRVKWVVWQDGDFEPFVPPPVGQSVVVGGA